MTPEEAEARIVQLCVEIDEARKGSPHRVEEIEREIRELKKVTGPRTITGTAGV